MKKTSRRKFGKQLTTALAVPAAALVNQSAFGQKSNANKSAPDDVRTSHNTPPDVVVSEGSLNIESHDPFAETPAGGGTFDYALNGMPQITHIRVLQDNGDKIYEDIEGVTREVRINWEDNNASPQGGTVRVFNDGNFKINSDRQLQGPGNNPPASHRRFKYGHPGNPNKRMRI